MGSENLSERDDQSVSEDTPEMARVVVHEVYPHKLENGSVQVLEPKVDAKGKPEVQTVRRVVADGLAKCGRGELHKSDAKSKTKGEGA